MTNQRRESHSKRTPLATTTVVVAAGPDAEYTVEAVEWFADWDPSAPVELMVAAADHTPETLAELESLRKRSQMPVTVLVSNTVTASCRRAAETATSDTLLFLDDRVRLPSLALRALRGAATRNPGAGACTLRLCHEEASIVEAGTSEWDGEQLRPRGGGEAEAAPHLNHAETVAAGSAWCMLVPQESWIEVGGFDTRFDSLSVALLDLGRSLTAAGRPVIYEPHAYATLRQPRDIEGEACERLAALRGQRPELGMSPGDLPPAASPRVLVLGIYLAQRLNNVADIVATLAASERCQVDQRWIGLGGCDPDPRVADVTALQTDARRPKFDFINELLAEQSLEAFDYVVLADDDILLPNRFLDALVLLQRYLRLAIAQPARTASSYIDHPIVQQHPGLVARETRFVEIGPVVSFCRSAYDLVFPFDLTSSMGWGYENVWSKRCADRGLRIGILDAVPVDHSLRPPVAHYDWSSADRERRDFLARHEHLPLQECFQVTRAISELGESA